MAVVFKTFESIEIDGVVAGNIVDVISNHPSRRAEVLEAFGVFTASITNEKTELQTQLSTANARIEQLTQQLPFNPRHTTPDFFVNRFTAKEAKAFYSSEDPVIVGGQQLLDQYEQAGYYIDLDSEEVQSLTAYMVQLGMLTEERRSTVLRDCTREEAYTG